MSNEREAFETSHKILHPQIKIRQQNLIGTYTDAQVDHAAFWFQAGAAYQRTQAQSAPAGYVLVPVEPFPPTSTPEPGWDSGYESGYNDAIAQIKSAPSQPQSDAVMVPRELLERVVKPVLFTSQEDSHYDACTELRALLGGDQPAQPDSAKVGDFKSGD